MILMEILFGQGHQPEIIQQLYQGHLQKISLGVLLIIQMMLRIKGLFH